MKFLASILAVIWMTTAGYALDLGLGPVPPSATTVTLAGDVTGSSAANTLKATGTAGTYTKVTTDAAGRVSSGTTLALSDIPALAATTQIIYGDGTGKAAGSAQLTFNGTSIIEGNGTGPNLHTVNSLANTGSGYKWQTASHDHWLLYMNGAESGANAGGDMVLSNFDDTGGYLGNVFIITRSSGVFAFKTVPRFDGTNSTGAGTATLGAANCPAVTPTAVYSWIQVTLADGSTAYLPAWK